MELPKSYTEEILASLAALGTPRNGEGKVQICFQFNFGAGTRLNSMKVINGTEREWKPEYLQFPLG